MRKLIREVHRRSLWQVLGIYLAGSWVALQVVETMTESMSLPEWVQPFAVVLLVIGLPIVLATAFVQEGVGRGGHARTASPRAEAPTGSSDSEAARARPGGSPPATPGGRSLLTWRRAILGGFAAFGLLAVAMVGWTALRSLGIGPAGTLVAKGVLEDQATLLLTEFDAEDPSLARAATEAFRVDLDQSNVIDLADPGFVTGALRRMERDPDAPLDVGVGRELAVREGLSALIAGEITRAGTGYVLTARVLSPDGEVLVSDRETAADDGELVPAIDRLSKKLRERIGESLRDLAGGPPLERVTTGDLAALRTYSQAIRLSDRGADEEAAALMEEVVARDSTFAMAWRKLGMLHVSGGGALGQMSRGVEALGKAYELRDRLTERERHLATAGYYSYVEVDPRRAARAYEQILEVDPDDGWALNNLGIIVGPDFGEYERAVELLERSMLTDTLSSTHHWNLSVAQSRVGRTEDTEATLDAWARRVPDDARALAFRAFHEASQRRLDEADRYASASADMRPGNLLERGMAEMIQGWNDAIRGRVGEAAGHFDAAEAAHRERGAAGEALGAAVWSAGIRMSVLEDRAGARTELAGALARYPLEEMGPLDPRWGQLANVYATIRGAEGAEMVRRWDEADPNAGSNPRRELALARVALAAGDPAAAIRRIQETRTPGCPPCRPGLLASAFDAAGEPDSAIVYYEAFLEAADLFRSMEDAHQLGPSIERLAQLYDEAGELEQAAKYYAMFVELWAGADRELQPRVQAAQARLEEIVRERG